MVLCHHRPSTLLRCQLQTEISCYKHGVSRETCPVYEGEVQTTREATRAESYQGGQTWQSNVSEMASTGGRTAGCIGFPMWMCGEIASESPAHKAGTEPSKCSGKSSPALRKRPI